MSNDRLEALSPMTAEPAVFRKLSDLFIVHEIN
jgi:hypothetical protein